MILLEMTFFEFKNYFLWEVLYYFYHTHRRSVLAVLGTGTGTSLYHGTGNNFWRMPRWLPPVVIRGGG